MFSKEINNDNVNKLEIYTKGILFDYCFVLDDNINLEPHVGKIPYLGDTKAEVLAIVKALEYLESFQIKHDPIHIYTCKNAIDFINGCIYERKNDKLTQNILLLISNKNVKFFDCKNNIANGYIE